MDQVEKMEFIKANDEKIYTVKLKVIIEDFNALGLEVNVSHAMCPANKGIGYMYSAVVVGKKG